MGCSEPVARNFLKYKRFGIGPLADFETERIRRTQRDRNLRDDRVQRDADAGEGSGNVLEKMRRVRDLETRLREQKEKEEQLEQEMLEEMKRKKQKKRAGLAPLGPVMAREEVVDPLQKVATSAPESEPVEPTEAPATAQAAAEPEPTSQTGQWQSLPRQPASTDWRRDEEEKKKKTQEQQTHQKHHKKKKKRRRGDDEEEKSEESEKHQRKRQRSRSRSVPVDDEAARKASSSSGLMTEKEVLAMMGKEKAKEKPQRGSVQARLRIQREMQEWNSTKAENEEFWKAPRFALCRLLGKFSASQEVFIRWSQLACLTPTRNQERSKVTLVQTWQILTVKEQPERRITDVTGCCARAAYPALSPRSGMMKRKDGDHLGINGVYALRKEPHNGAPCWAQQPWEGSVEVWHIFRSRDRTSWVIDSALHSAGRDDAVAARLIANVEDPTAAADCWVPIPALKLVPFKSRSGYSAFAPGDESEEVAKLRVLIQEAIRERDEALARRQQIESDSVRRNKSSAADIAQQRIRFEASRVGLDSSKSEANRLRQKCHLDAKKKQSSQEQNRKALARIVDAQEYKKQLECQVALEKEEVQSLLHEVSLLKGEIKASIERKVLKQVELTGISHMGLDDRTVAELARKYSMSSGSDSEPEVVAEQEEQDDTLDDLELTYEGLELSSVMPIRQALRLASGHMTEKETMSKVDIPETGLLEREGVEFSRWTRPSPSGNKEWSEEELEQEFGEHLRNLEKLLNDLRREQAEEAEDRRCKAALAALKKKKKEEAAGEKVPAPKMAMGFSWGFTRNSTQNFTHEPAEPEAPKVSVVSGFSNFSPYAVMCRKYTKLAF
ncbi:unnamed protein product [Symbiodinium natans]|uniref:Uncharacterized protein n=1 Tax=Symbiodinium natans TaxID=878477 RepID=A0A812TBG1_9DINO|nr:unnamed protein product [Symbiodinium natans]